MLNDENACIRYLMKEMDPSEEVLMERAMMEDDDLLIEVECLRQTFHRLEGLPEKEPPAHLTESIIEQAKEYRKKQDSYFYFISQSSYKYAAAASVVIVLTLGGIWMTGGFNETSEVAATQDTVQYPILPNSFKVTPVTMGKPAPWVDNNNVLRFQDQANANAEFDTILKNSMQKLTPITEPFSGGSGSRSLQMTGASTNN